LSTFLLIAGALQIYSQSAPAPGQKVIQGPRGAYTVYLADGLDVEFDAQGNWNKVYSTYHQPVDFPDRRGIKKSQVIAEEKAKAQIVRHMGEMVSSERIIEELDVTLQTAERTQGSGAKDKLTKTTQRTMKDSLQEFTRSYAQKTLSGVTVFETGYDSDAEEAWVKSDLVALRLRLPTVSEGEIKADRAAARRTLYLRTRRSRSNDNPARSEEVESSSSSVSD
jgi:hypothetical protein